MPMHTSRFSYGMRDISTDPGFKKADGRTYYTFLEKDSAELSERRVSEGFEERKRKEIIRLINEKLGERT